MSRTGFWRRAAALAAAATTWSCGGRTVAPPPVRGGDGVEVPARDGRLRIGLGDRIVRAEVRETFAGRAAGYMGRERIADDEALLFVYPEKDVRGFWMKNCRTTIDALYLDDDGTVVNVVTMPPPPPGAADDDLPRYPSARPVRLVLEVRGGLAAEAGIVAGAVVGLPPEVASLVAKAER